MTKPRFLGFILANEQEWFLQDYRNASGVAALVWTPFPEYAKRFPHRRAADFAIPRLEAGYPVYVVELFDDGGRFAVVADVDGPRPSWLAALH